MPREASRNLRSKNTGIYEKTHLRRKGRMGSVLA